LSFLGGVKAIIISIIYDEEDKMETGGKKRILLGKMGLDAHDNGIIIIAKWLSDAGFEVIYAGLYNTPEGIVQSALQEGVDAIGCSFLGGEHLYYARRLIELIKERHVTRIKLILGGVIPPEDVDELKRLGVAHVFTPGTLRDTIIEALNELFKEAS
jgi:methylmalonyl-CoA mutase C-terminal domain/subunit